MSEAVPLYDSFAEYDAMVNWEERLRRESPFLQGLLRRVGARRVLDVGCGTGRHAIHLAEQGFEVVGVDPSQQMIERAVANAGDIAGASFTRAGFGELRATVEGTFDAIICLGNTLPHILSQGDLVGALDDMAAMIRPGGVLVVQQLNYDRILAQRQRFLGLTEGKRGDTEYLFFRFYDFEGEAVTFNLAIMSRRGGGAWEWRVESTRLQPILSTQLCESLMRSGFVRLVSHGSFAGEPYNPLSSNDLVVVGYYGEPD